MAWTIPTFAADQSYDSPDLSTIIQEIVDRGGWASGNALILVANDNGSDLLSVRTIYTFDASPTSFPAILTITYS